MRLGIHGMGILASGALVGLGMWSCASEGEAPLPGEPAAGDAQEQTSSADAPLRTRRGDGSGRARETRADVERGIAEARALRLTERHEKIASADTSFDAALVNGQLRSEGVRGLTAAYHASSVTLTKNDRGVPASLSWTSVGRGGAATAVASAAPTADDNQVVMQRGASLEEAWLNGAAGLVHRITIAEPPQGDGEIVVTLAVDGVTPHLVPGGEQIRFTSPGGARHHLNYSGLYVTDASGAEVPSRLSVQGDVIGLGADDAGAEYPLVFETVVHTAAGDTLYRGQYKAGSDVFASVDQATGVPTAIGNIGFGVQELACEPATGIMYAATGAGISGSGTGGSLATINLATGVGTIIAAFTGLSQGARSIQGLAITDNGVMYSTAFDFSNSSTPGFTVDKATAVLTPFVQALPTLERATGLTTLGGPASGALIAYSGTNGSMDFFQIDIANVTSTAIQTIQLPVGFTRLKDLTEFNGQHYAILNEDGAGAASLVTVDVAAGTITQIGADGALGTSVHGLSGNCLSGNGTACTTGNECASGFCVDGVCCDTACTDDCESCLAADTAEADDGTCAPVTTADVCRAGSGDACDPDEVCDGVSGSCPANTISPAGTVCRAGSGDGCDPDETCTGFVSVACGVDVVQPDGTACDAGTGPQSGECMSGMCEEVGTGGAGGSGTGGSASGGMGTGGTGTGGTGTGATGGSTGSGGGDVQVDDGCGCRVVGDAPAERDGAWLVLLGAGALLSRRRRGL